MQLATSVYRRIAALDDKNPLMLKFDESAQLLFQVFQTELEQGIRGSDISPAMQAHLSKYRSLMPSLALLFALADGHSQTVPITYAKQACDWCEYLKTHAHRVYASQIKPEHRAAITLSGKLARGWKRTEEMFTLRDVYRSGSTGLDTPDAARRALQVLADYGWVRPVTLGDPRATGRPSEVYLRNPRIEAKHAGK